MTAGRDDIRGGLLHFDCPAGVAGDMTVAALVDLGVPESVIRGALAALPLTGYRVRFERTLRGGITGTRFHVDLPSAQAEDSRAHGPGEVDTRGAHAHDPARHHEAHHQHAHDHDHGDQHHRHHHRHRHHGDAPPRRHLDEPEGHAPAHRGHHAHRHYRDIRAMLTAAALPAGVRGRALDTFDRVAAVEGRLHGLPVEEVAFHELGAVDSIVDIVAASAALDWLAPRRVSSRKVALGHGSVQTAHGLLPVPAPATLQLLAGAPVEDGGVPFELTTPTGAALLASNVERWGSLPPMRVAGVGWGAGGRELPDRPNLLRVIAGTPLSDDQPDDERCLVLETNVDDMSPELLAPLIGDLLGAGARDAWIAPVLMKKGRPGHLVSALVDPPRREAVEAVLFRGSTSIGVRRYEVARTVLPRRMVEVETPFGTVPVKVSGADGDENVAPELEVCLRLARERGVPLKRVHAEAIAAFYRR